MSGAKVLAIASGGGHWVQLMRLRPALEGMEVVYCSVHKGYAEQVPGSRFWLVNDVSRKNPFGALRLAFQLLRVLFAERPDVLVTTGSFPALVAIALARPMGIRSLWIDSIANCEQLSSSGAAAARIADRCVSQWPDVATRSGVKYWGSVL